MTSPQPSADSASPSTAPAPSLTSKDKDRNGLPLIPTNWETIRVALEHLDDGFSIYDSDLNLIAWNKRFFDLTGFPVDRFAYVGARFEDFIRYNAGRGEYGPGNPEEQIRIRVERAKRFEPHSLVRKRPNGMVLEIRGNPMPGGGFVSVYKDITQQKRAEDALKRSNDELESRVQQRTGELQQALEKLKASEEWIRLIADAVPAVIGYVQEGLRYTFANRQYKEWFGLEPEQIIGMPVEKVLGRKVHREHLPCINAAMRGEATQREFNHTTPSGRELQILANFIPHKDETGKVLGYFVLGQNVTDVRMAEFKFRQAQKMEAIGQLTGGLSHDFNNLLTIIVGNLSVLQDEIGEDDSLRDLLDPALDAGRRGADLVKRLLAFARRQPLKAKVTKPDVLVSDMEELLRRALGAEFDLIITLDQDCWPVEIDPHQLENAILNLAINGRDAMEKDGGTLRIDLENVHLNRGFSDRTIDVSEGDYVVISVSDNGEGMGPEVVERVFEPFFTTKDKGKGSGLGLSMVYGFVRQSGGHIQVDSALGKGTTLRIVLPRCAKGAEIAPAPEKITPPKGHERILLAEDDPGVRAFAANSLRRLGYEVVAVANGSEALGVLELDQDFDLLFTDVEMPGGINGIELADVVSKSYPDLPVLFMSGYPDKVADRAGLDPQHLHLLPKPFEQRDLAQKVRNALDGR